MSLSLVSMPATATMHGELLVFSEDITVRKQAEHALQESREQYRQLVEDATDVVYRTDANGYFTFVNPAAVQLTGRSEASLIGLRFTDLVHPDSVVAARRFYYRQFLTQQPSSYYEFPLLQAEGKVVWVGQNVRLLFSSAGQPVGFQAIVRDISERRAVEENLAKALVAAETAQSELSTILAATPDTLIFVNQRREIRAISNAYLHQFGGQTPPERLVGHPFERLLAAAQRRFADPDALFTWANHLLKLPTGRGSIEVRQHWPEPKVFVVSATPVTTAEGEYEGRLFLFHDVTKEREIVRLKDELLSHVSHELKNPLATIMGYTDLLLHDPERTPTPRQSEFLNIVMDSSKQQLDLVNDLLDLSRLEEGLDHLSLGPVDLARVVAQVEASLRPQARAGAITVVLGALQGITVHADHERLVQVLNNLLSNAIKYTPQGGSVMVDAAAEDAGVRVTVTDTGIGMSPSEQAQIFTRFYRAPRASATASGTGLGLAVTKALVEAHGGAIGCASTVGEGSTFWFTLPAPYAAAIERVGDKPEPA